jgi:hypothetical protein
MIENRKTYRLPFRGKFVFGTQDEVRTGNCTNISAGGLFVMTLEPFPRDTRVKCLFLLTPEGPPLSVEGIVKRVVSPSVSLEDTPGIGLNFVDLSEQVSQSLDHFLSETRKSFEITSTLLMAGEPDLASLEPLLEKMHLPPYADFGELKFFIERILKSIELVDKNSQ